jgi:hypothetical protein
MMFIGSHTSFNKQSDTWTLCLLNLCLDHTHTFFTGPAETSKKQQHIYIEYTFVLLTQFKLVWGSNPGGGENFRTCPEQPWGPPGVLYNGNWVFPRVKVARA